MAGVKMEENKYYQKSVQDCLKNFDSSSEGLSENVIETRLVERQKYNIKDAKKPSLFIKFLWQIKELMVLVLLFSGVVSIIIGIIGKTSGEIIDGAIILGIVVMNACFGVYQERKSEKAIESLKKMTQPESMVLRDGKVVKVKNTEIVLGDVVYLEAGSIVPADLRLIETSDIKINESSLTGESEPVEKFADIVYDKEMPLADQKNMAFAGSVVENGHAKGLVVFVGTQTEIGKIAESIRETKKEMTPLQKNIQSVGKVLTYLILLMATVTFILEVVSNPTNILQAFLTAVAISVAAIPESMPAVITIIMSLGISRLA
ncbi:MAG: HAD-IC family P-type ATPase, partial [Clostridia bacterium]|nr:HAD-IC family P-type ATPase [Clostridia bacterium]